MEREPVAPNIILLSQDEKNALTRQGISIRKISRCETLEMKKVYITLRQIAVNPIDMHAKISEKDEQCLENIRNSYEARIAATKMEQAS
jgi:hypothetical protein